RGRSRRDGPLGRDYGCFGCGIGQRFAQSGLMRIFDRLPAAISLKSRYDWESDWLLGSTRRQLGRGNIRCRQNLYRGSRRWNDFQYGWQRLDHLSQRVFLKAQRAADPSARIIANRQRYGPRASWARGRHTGLLMMWDLGCAYRSAKNPKS